MQTKRGPQKSVLSKPGVQERGNLESWKTFRPQMLYSSQAPQKNCGPTPTHASKSQVWRLDPPPVGCEQAPTDPPWDSAGRRPGSQDSPPTPSRGSRPPPSLSGGHGGRRGSVPTDPAVTRHTSPSPHGRHQWRPKIESAMPSTLGGEEAAAHGVGWGHGGAATTHSRPSLPGRCKRSPVEPWKPHPPSAGMRSSSQNQGVMRGSAETPGSQPHPTGAALEEARSSRRLEKIQDLKT